MRRHATFMMVLLVAFIFCGGCVDTAQTAEQNASVDLQKTSVAEQHMTLQENACEAKWTEINLAEYFDNPIRRHLLAANEDYLLFSLALETFESFNDPYMANMLVLYSMATEEMQIISKDEPFSVAEAALSEKYIYCAEKNISKASYSISQIEIANPANKNILIDAISAGSVFTSPNFETVNESILLRIGDQAQRYSGIYRIENDALVKTYQSGSMDEISNTLSCNGNTFSFFEKNNDLYSIVTADTTNELCRYTPPENRVAQQFAMDAYGLWTCETQNTDKLEQHYFLTYRNEAGKCWIQELPQPFYRFKSDGKGVLMVRSGKIYYLTSDGMDQFYCTEIGRKGDGTEKQNSSFLCKNISAQKYAAELTDKPLSIDIFEWNI